MLTKSPPRRTRSGLKARASATMASRARNIVGMRAGMKIGQKKHSERMRPPRPTIDYEPQSANQMRTRASNALKATFSAELVAKGRPRNRADQTIPQSFAKHISILAIISHQTEIWRTSLPRYRRNADATKWHLLLVSTMRPFV